MNRGSKWLVVSLVAVALSSGIGAARAEGPVEIVEHTGQWELAYGLVYYRVFGEVKNVSAKPLRYVKFRMTLLDSEGKSVLERTAYNQRAEGLADQETEGYVETLTFEEKLAQTKPLGEGEQELFRVGLAKEDIPAEPRFVRYRLEVIEASNADGATGKPLPVVEGSPAAQGASAGKGLNINTADEKELLELPEMNEARARAILNHRKGNGPLIQLEELALIPQVTPIYPKIRDRLTLE